MGKLGFKNLLAIREHDSTGYSFLRFEQEKSTYMKNYFGSIRKIPLN
jgi:hypothetical protein